MATAEQLGQDILKSAFPQPVMFAFFCVVGSLATDDFST